MSDPNTQIRAQELYGYRPSLPASVVGAVVFVCVAVATGYQYGRYHAWFLYMLLAGVGLETVALVARVVSIDQPSNVWAFLLAYLLPILAPSFMAAACYMTFSRILWYVTPSQCRNFRTLWLPARWVAPLFLLLDMGAFFIQFLGVAAAASAYTQDKDLHKQQIAIANAVHVLRFGLVVQLLCFGVFALIGCRFMVISRTWTVPDINPRPTWRRLAWSVNAAATLIMLRGIYRVFEFSSSASRAQTYVTTHEWLFWTCDVIPVLAVFILFIVVHPGRSLPSSFIRWRLNKKALKRSLDGDETNGR